MDWRWAKKSKKDKRFPSSTFLTCKVASSKLLERAIIGTKIFQFVEEIGPKGEIVDPPKGRRKAKIAVTELGRGILLPENYSLFRSYDPEDIIQKVLIKQIMKTLDRCSAEALKQNPLNITTSMATIRKLIPGAKWNNIEALCGIISGYMSSCAVPYVGDRYVGIGGEGFLRAIKQHPKLLLWKEYLNEGDLLFEGEIGATLNIRWVECEDTKIFQGDGVVFGNRGLLIKEITPTELRIYKSIIAWYGLLDFVGQNVLHIPDLKRRRHEKV